MSGTSAFAANAQKNFIRTITQRTVTAAPRAAGTAPTDSVQWPELSASVGDGAESAGTTKSKGNGPDRSQSAHFAQPTPTPTTPAATFTAPAGSDSGFEGVNLYQQRRVADNGNQFTVDPPDQGLCVGNGKVLEIVNDSYNIFDATTHQSVLPRVRSANEFFGRAPEIVRGSGSTPTVYGPEPTDPSCLFDQATNRWYLIVVTLDVNSATGDLTGKNQIDLAVSQTGDPTGAWNFYSINAIDDGTDGTPSHPNCPCLGDYPHIGADANGIYITTNEYSFFGPEFNGAQVYALSKSALAAGAQSVTVTQIDTSAGNGHDDSGKPGFTLWPAQAPPGGSNVADTEYFLSSNAAVEVGSLQSGSIVLWTMTGTSSLSTNNPSLGLQAYELRTAQNYYLPPPGPQAPGDWPLGQCLNQTKCAKAINGKNDPHHEVIGTIDTNDTRMQQVMYAGGLLYGALDTAVLVGTPAKVRAGIAWYAVNPGARTIVHEGQFGVAGADVTYPAIGVNSSGVGAMAMTLSGDTTHPSAAYVPLSGGSVSGTQVVTVGAGQGVADSFSFYQAFPPFRPRWGDYGAAAVDESGTTWLASEYTAQSCTLTAWLADTTCGHTRAPLGNWSTHIATVPAS